MSAFSHRHYEEIADAIALVSEQVSIGNIEEGSAFNALVEVLKFKFGQDNPKFNVKRFDKACSEVK